MNNRMREEPDKLNGVDLLPGFRLSWRLLQQHAITREESPGESSKGPWLESGDE
jgi:hypothetical protein